MNDTILPPANWSSLPATELAALAHSLAFPRDVGKRYAHF